MYNIANVNTISDRIPMDTRREMSPSHFLILDLVVSLMKSTSKRSPSRAFYAFPSQNWIAQRLGYTRSYISESITSMAKLDLLDVTHRRKVSGRWQTNLYRIGIVLARALNMVSSWISSFINRVEKNRHIVNKPSISKNIVKEKGTFNSKSPPLVSEVMQYIHELKGKITFRS